MFDPGSVIRAKPQPGRAGVISTERAPNQSRLRGRQPWLSSHYPALRGERNSTHLRPVALAVTVAGLGALGFFREVSAFERGRRVAECLLVAPEPSIPAAFLRNNAAPDKALHGFS